MNYNRTKLFNSSKVQLEQKCLVCRAAKYARFNSSKVQLEPKAAVDRAKAFIRFNSSKVQLELSFVEECLGDNLFQFK